MKDFKYYFLRSLPIILIIAIIAVFVMISDMQEQVDEFNEINNEYNVNTDDNDGLFNDSENLSNNEDEELINNEIVTNENKNTVSTANVTVIEKNPSKITNEQKEEISTTDNKQKAVDMVKKQYGDGMEYFCDSILSSGEFVVAAKIPGSSTISSYYKVNIETGKISIMF